jgi:hypothetical protein
MEEAKSELRQKLFAELEMEEETENQLIWLYRTLLDMGVENCIGGGEGQALREGMTILYEESKLHKVVINNLIKKYQ